MIISFLIKALLEENSVSVAKLGTFYVKKMSAYIQEDIVFPPQNMIEFDYSKEIEGFDFVNKLSKWQQIRIDEAQDKILEWVDLLEKGLEHNKTVYFENFGTFSKDNSDKIVFQSLVIPQLNIENEGLEPVFIPLKKEDDIKPPVKDKRIVLQKKKKKRDLFWFILTISVAVVLLFVLFFKNEIKKCCQTVFTKNEYHVILDTTNNEKDLSINNVEDEQTAEIELPVETITEQNPNLSTNNIEVIKDEKKNDNLISLAIYKELYVPYNKGYFYVIAGSFMQEESALLHIKQKKLEQYHAKLIVHPQSPRIRVCVGIFDNEEEANKIAGQLDKNYWVLK
ncbi:MAG: SPOR domain-containing protein [Lentimicrobiaceae bacterium]|nr:SPOR domain-containing protein [Lentimicrobiaceae bacterium]